MMGTEAGSGSGVGRGSAEISAFGLLARSRGLLDYQKTAAATVGIVGAGAVGSHLAPMLARMGAGRIILVDYDTVSPANVGIQGFLPRDIGRQKAEVVAETLRAINPAAEIVAVAGRYEPRAEAAAVLRGLPGAYVFACADSMRTRSDLARDFSRRGWAWFFDSRMGAETLRVFSVPATAAALAQYRRTLFPESEAARLPCTARGTIYCASMAAAILALRWKQAVMGEAAPVETAADIPALDFWAPKADADAAAGERGGA